MERCGLRCKTVEDHATSEELLGTQVRGKIDQVIEVICKNTIKAEEKSRWSGKLITLHPDGNLTSPLLVMVSTQVSNPVYMSQIRADGIDVMNPINQEVIYCHIRRITKEKDEGRGAYRRMGEQFGSGRLGGSFDEEAH